MSRAALSLLLALACTSPPKSPPAVSTNPCAAALDKLLAKASGSTRGAASPPREQRGG